MSALKEKLEKLTHNLRARVEEGTASKELKEKAKKNVERARQEVAGDNNPEAYASELEQLNNLLSQLDGLPEGSDTQKRPPNVSNGAPREDRRPDIRNRIRDFLANADHRISATPEFVQDLLRELQVKDDEISKLFGKRVAAIKEKQRQLDRDLREEEVEAAQAQIEVEDLGKALTAEIEAARARSATNEQRINDAVAKLREKAGLADKTAAPATSEATSAPPSPENPANPVFTGDY